jgi:hypothetical protein
MIRADSLRPNAHAVCMTAYVAARLWLTLCVCAQRLSPRPSMIFWREWNASTTACQAYWIATEAGRRALQFPCCRPTGIQSAMDCHFVETTMTNVNIWAVPAPQVDWTTLEELKIRANDLGCGPDIIAYAERTFGDDLNHMANYLQRVVIDRDLAELKILRSTKRPQRSRGAATGDERLRGGDALPASLNSSVGQVVRRIGTASACT